MVLSDLREMLEIDRITLAPEEEFKGVFPDCELGAMPPFGNLYGIPVYVAGRLAAEPEIAFNACNHTETVTMSWAEYERVARPVLVDIAEPASHAA